MLAGRERPALGKPAASVAAARAALVTLTKGRAEGPATCAHRRRLPIVSWSPAVAAEPEAGLAARVVQAAARLPAQEPRARAAQAAEQPKSPVDRPEPAARQTTERRVRWALVAQAVTGRPAVAVAEAGDTSAVAERVATAFHLASTAVVAEAAHRSQASPAPRPFRTQKAFARATVKLCSPTPTRRW